MSIVKYIFEGRLTKDPEVKSYGDNKKMTVFSVASDIGFGDYKRTVFHNCVATGKVGENITKYFSKGDQIIIEGEPSQKKKDDKVYYSVVVNNFSFGQSKSKDNQQQPNHKPEDNPFDDDSVPF